MKSGSIRFRSTTSASNSPGTPSLPRMFSFDGSLNQQRASTPPALLLSPSLPNLGKPTRNSQKNLPKLTTATVQITPHKLAGRESPQLTFSSVTRRPSPHPSPPPSPKSSRISDNPLTIVIEGKSEPHVEDPSHPPPLSLDVLSPLMDITISSPHSPAIAIPKNPFDYPLPPSALSLSGELRPDSPIPQQLLPEITSSVMASNYFDDTSPAESPVITAETDSPAPSSPSITAFITSDIPTITTTTTTTTTTTSSSPITVTLTDSSTASNIVSEPTEPEIIVQKPEEITVHIQPAPQPIELAPTTQSPSTEPIPTESTPTQSIPTEPAEPKISKPVPVFSQPPTPIQQETAQKETPAEVPVTDKPTEKPTPDTPPTAIHPRIRNTPPLKRIPSVSALFFVIFVSLISV